MQSKRSANRWRRRWTRTGSCSPRSPISPRPKSLRVAQRNLDHATHAYAHFDGRRDLAGLIEAQQEWIRQMMQDYATQSLHYAEMFQNLTQGMRRQAEHAASEFAAEAEESAKEFGKKSEAMMHQPQRAAE